MPRLWRLWSAALLALILGLMSDARALTSEEAHAIAAGDNDARIAALQKLVAKGDPALPAFLQALAADSVKVAAGKAYIVNGDEVKEAATGQPAKLPEGAEDVVNNNRMGSEIEAALAAGKLASKDAAVRAEAIDALSKAADESKLGVIDKALATETDAKLVTQLKAVRAKALLSSADPLKRLEAVKALSEEASPEARALLMERMAEGADPAETDAAVKGAMQAALGNVNRKLAWGE